MGRHCIFTLALMLAICGISRSAISAGYLCVEVEPDGDAFLRNMGDADVSFDGYTLACETGCLDPVGWKSISDYVPGEISYVMAELGAGALTFGEANPASNALSELNLGGAAVAKPGLRFPMGRPIDMDAPRGRLTFDGSVGGVIVRPPNGGICVPEPSALALLVIGAAVIGLRRFGPRR